MNTRRAVATVPSHLHVVSNTASGVELAWNPSTDESEFDYHVAGTPCSPLVVRGDTTHVRVPSVATDPVCGLVPGSTAPSRSGPGMPWAATRRSATR